jgi:hypothetical protein
VLNPKLFKAFRQIRQILGSEFGENSPSASSSFLCLTIFSSVACAQLRGNSLCNAVYILLLLSIVVNSQIYAMPFFDSSGGPSVDRSLLTDIAGDQSSVSFNVVTNAHNNWSTTSRGDYYHGNIDPTGISDLVLMPPANQKQNHYFIPTP